MINRYTYVDLQNDIVSVVADDLNFAGNWVAGIRYFPNDVVIFNNTRYVCLQTVLGVSPTTTTTRDNFWSVLVFVSQGTTNTSPPQPSGDFATVQQVNDVYSLAFRAYNLALEGTQSGGGGDGVPSWVMGWIGQTYNLAIQGTNDSAIALAAAASALTSAAAAQSTANSAQTTANQAVTAVNATWSFAGQAYSLAVAGTTAANSADSWGRDAFSLAVSGTKSANSADLWGRTAYSLAVAGTNAAQNAQITADTALALFTGTQAGTNTVFVLKSETGANYRFKDGQVQFFDMTAYTSNGTKPWRAMGVDGGLLIWSDPIDD